jgi:Predicted transcriptional regulator
MKRVRNRFHELLARKARHEGRRISQRTAADETGLAKATIDRYARNDVTRYDEPILLVLCDYLKCSVSDLLVIEEVAVEGNGDESPETETPLAAIA